MAAAIPVLAIALTVLFLLMQMAPGDPFAPEPGPSVSRDTTAVRRGWLPVSQMHAPGAVDMSASWRFWDAARHLVLPWISLTLPAAAGIALLVRETVSDALKRPYVQTARARGLPWGRVVVRHA